MLDAEIFEPAGGSDTVFYLIGHGSAGKQVCEKLCGADVTLVFIPCPDWDRDLSPWPAAGIYNERGDFAGGGEVFLSSLSDSIPALEAKLTRAPKQRGIAGYSMAGLFALWAVYRRGDFDLAVSGSGSTWYENWDEFITANRPQRAVRFYLSVGRREKKSRNKRLARVVSATEATAAALAAQGYEVCFELNEGGHFDDADGRIARGIMKLL